MEPNANDTLSPAALQCYLATTDQAVEAVAERFEREAADVYARFGPAGMQACRQDIRYTVDFLRPAVEFGLHSTFADYIAWLKSVLASRQIPADHVSLMLTWLAEFYQAHLDPHAGKVVSRALENARDQTGWEDAVVQSIGSHCPAAWPGVDELKNLLLDGRRREAVDFLQRAMHDGAGLVDIELHLLQPALYQIGRDWQNNQISVAQEHLATATATAVITQLETNADYAEPNGRRVLLACVAGNRHTLGLHIVCNGFESAGWDVRYLGADVPTPALIKEVQRYEPDLVGLSVSMPYQFDDVRRVMTALDTALDDAKPAVMIGGLAINGFPQITSQLGTGLTAADAEAAVTLANRTREPEA